MIYTTSVGIGKRGSNQKAQKFSPFDLQTLMMMKKVMGLLLVLLHDDDDAILSNTEDLVRKVMNHPLGHDVLLCWMKKKNIPCSHQIA